ncbi:MAG TPA: serine dehydratase subunit alpha family protein [Candidatus Egerieicola pullicola]|uniref:UPF0597 protein IAB36_02115 n=1 Tax=Candidatus Egerieicola pullicola TaxID=2840775 RepID=A0A9D1DCQ9_9FIRM|nr:serine dehydratase subunit alpha family protein [Candidatus Egerieicola pullicola]
MEQMVLDRKVYQAYLDVLRQELVPATGCTEPIAIAYAGAIARKTLGQVPEQVELIVSGNIIKNVKSVVIPHSNGRKGLEAAVAAGIICGRPELELDVLSQTSPEDLQQLDAFLAGNRVQVRPSQAECPFDIQVKLTAGQDNAYVRIIGSHSNVVQVQKNGQLLVDHPFSTQGVSADENHRLLNVKDIVTFADTVDLDEVRPILQRQIDDNMAIAQAGLTQNYGANIGKILLRSYGNSVHNRAKAWAAAGSDARMNGCEMPVIINSGSGNQGITASVPVIVYAKECDVSQEQLYRALVVSNLTAIHLKTGIGSLSAYCGATSAGCGAGAGVCYLYGGKYKEISHTIVNALAINSGMLCDGAKASCAAKIASAVEAGLLGMQMYLHNSQFYGGDGIVAKGVENTIRTVSTIAREGMRSTDAEIIQFMIGNSAPTKEKDPQHF